MHAEETMISKLKLRMGMSFTSKLEGMLHDLRRSAEVSKEYMPILERFRARTGAEGCVDFGVSVLTSGFWPTPMDLPSVVLPPEMKTCVDHFSLFHKERYPRRTLQWVFAEGGVDLAIRFEARRTRLTFSVSTLQAVALIALSDSAPVTLEDLAKRVGVDVDVIKRVVHPLVFVKGELLTRKPACVAAPVFATSTTAHASAQKPGRQAVVKAGRRRRRAPQRRIQEQAHGAFLAAMCARRPC